ncbi:MAG: hypothetical protein LBL75_03850 [Rickettsiales bacterium]|jgi:hypothetical protein|nr:hypothetical protein [Rickettsiales bacterium]
MKKSGIFSFAIAMIMGLGAADAAYPAYGAQTQYVQVAGSSQYSSAANRSAVPQTYAGASSTSVASSSANRVTGALPRVGTASTTAGRSYYQPADYDRLADSGLYVGLSVGYMMGVNGGMLANYRGESDGYFAPGSFDTSDYKTDTILPLQLSIGAAINSDVRVDFSYTRFSGLSYADSVKTSNGAELIDVSATGGAISSTATMINLYYNLDSFTGYMAGGSLSPYVGVGLGISTNTIADYLVYDPSFYSENGIVEGNTYPAGVLTAISDIYAYHAGGTTEQLSYMIEGGVTTEMEGGIKLDFFVRYSGMGKVQSSGSVVVSQTDWLSTGGAAIGQDGAEVPSEFDSVFHYTNWYESGKLSTIDAGVRMRIQF